ncbi:hypothetical protein [Dyella mobilis]|uniref:Sel1 repeat-containing protein n=1 Tax=Dyella mobilis TaxID=1849582 RepID=A0ABS2KEU9_9GAMM|nr:hypothetical protein [Dyella mobilis]MBM7129575.1 hypothetical protein [Dyella mobilis]GLQ98161.1 hypothetical protein GCM10007863_25810 [Dyella mobilis]
MNVESKYILEMKEKAGAAFKRHDFQLALALSEKLVEENVPSAFFTCGLIMERGWLNGVADLEKALFFYRNLAIKFNDDEGYLGCVRIFLARRELVNREKAMRYCQDATRGRLRHLAYLLMGRVYEELYEVPEYTLARKAYLASFFSGSAWALRKYALSLKKSHQIVGSVLIHIVATVVSPIMVLFGGVRVTRKG